MKTLLILFLFISTTAFSSIMTDDLGISWGMNLSKLKVHITNQLMKKYPKYDTATSGEQDLIIKKVKDNINKILKNKIIFKEKNVKYDNSIYAGEFNYNNNESMITFIENKKTFRFFMIKDVLWKEIIIVEADVLGKKYNLTKFINHFSNKYKLKPYKIEYDKFKTDPKVPLKAYFKDDSTLLSLSYNDIYESFIIVYASIDVMKALRKRGFKVIVKSDINLDVDVGADVKGYEQLLYETDETSNEDDDDTKDIFTEIDQDFKKEAKESKERKKKREIIYKTKKK